VIARLDLTAIADDDPGRSGGPRPPTRRLELARDDRRRPLFGQIVAVLRTAIEDAATEGARLPTERELARLFAVSRITVRRALHELERMGLIHRRVGSGTFCTPVRAREPRPLEVGGDARSRSTPGHRPQALGFQEGQEAVKTRGVLASAKSPNGPAGAIRVSGA
jgi:DNA-binding transcriptional MocR family regulator